MAHWVPGRQVELWLGAVPLKHSVLRLAELSGAWNMEKAGRDSLTAILDCTSVCNRCGTEQSPRHAYPRGCSGTAELSG